MLTQRTARAEGEQRGGSAAILSEANAIWLTDALRRGKGPHKESFYATIELCNVLSLVI